MLKVHQEQKKEKEKNNNEEVVVFSDGSRINSSSVWAEDLKSEVEERFKSSNPPQKTMQEYAGGILKNWRKNGEASSAAAARKRKVEATAAAANEEKRRKAEADDQLLAEAKKSNGPPSETRLGKVIVRRVMKRSVMPFAFFPSKPTHPAGMA